MNTASKPVFAEVILPLALPKLYTYALPFELAEKVQIGHRVIVQFGKKKIYSAIVHSIHHQMPAEYQPKLIEEIADEKPVVTQAQLKLWQWMSTYYMCTLGEVMAAALPSALKLSSETVFLYNEVSDADWSSLSDDAFILAEALQANSELKLEDVQAILGRKTVYPIVEELMVQRICVVKEELQQKYSPKTVAFIGLNQRYQSERAINALFEKLENKPKQADVVMCFLQMSPNKKPVLKAELLKNEKLSSSSLQTLVKNEILTEEKQTVSRLLEDALEIDALELLNEEQQNSLKEIQNSFKERDVVVLEGVTGSGKTHVYIKLIEEQIEKGNQVLYLLPEIALTAQIVMRLKKYFGERVGIYHSKFNEQERVEIYRNVLLKKYDVVLSARSGVFLPFRQLGLVIVDEEHERSFKQFDPAPRYHARDVAVIMTHFYGCKTLLGTATLSLETYRNVEAGKYGKVQMHKRFGNAVLPEIELLDTVDLKKRKQMSGIFSNPMKEAIAAALAQKEQVILFLNRRGFASYLNCNVCDWVPYCPHCDVSLTYHKFFNKLICHYCNYQEMNPKSCKACGSNDLNVKGIGTEQVEDEISIIFPEAKVGRLDLDTTRRKHGHEEIIFDFQDKKIDVLIGTQMVTKGLDFDNVSVVGIINADQLLNIPDFRTGERAFQLVAQVSGRAGRKDKKGRVLVQTANPENYILQAVKEYDFNTVLFHEMNHRKMYLYPPFTNLIQITLKHKQAEAVSDAALQLANILRARLCNRILGPTTPMISRINNQFLKQILIKLEKDSTFIKNAKAEILQAVDEIHSKFKTVRVVIDVDP
jgi:primosomal protein N' (replication factor Y) (superfamily II helicase)